MWQLRSKQLQRQLPANLHIWMFKAYNLTTQLKAVAPDHCIRKLEIGRGKAFNALEADVLSARSGYLRRIVHEIHNNQRVVYARVAIPDATYQLMEKALGDMGDKPIGSAILYNNRAVTRSRFRYAKVLKSDPAFADAFAVLKPKDDFLWARYSVFYWEQQPFTILEFFSAERLPAIEQDAASSVGFHKLRNKILDYSYLIRLHRPIPILLILWPMYWALWIAADGFPGWKIFIIFTVGAFLMRSAGDIMNDVADRHLDKHVERTKLRPITTGRVSVKEAVVFAAVLCLVAFLLVLLLNWLCVVLSVVALLLTLVYPLMKRITYWPQVVLGVAYNWGVVMAFAAVQNHVPWLAWLLLFLTVVWTVAYDTLYALADRQYDIANGIKSTAVRFGRMAEAIIALLDSIFLFGIAWVGVYLQLPLWFFIFLAVCVPFFIYQLRLVRGYDIRNCIRAFANNHWVGLIILLGFLTGH